MKNPNQSSELREGIDKQLNAHGKAWPKIATPQVYRDAILDAVIAALPEELYMTTRTVGSIGSYNEALSDVKEVLKQAKSKEGRKDGK